MIVHRLPLTPFLKYCPGCERKVLPFLKQVQSYQTPPQLRLLPNCPYCQYKFKAYATADKLVPLQILKRVIFDIMKGDLKLIEMLKRQTGINYATMDKTVAYYTLYTLADKWSHMNSRKRKWYFKMHELQT